MSIGRFLRGVALAALAAACDGESDPNGDPAEWPDDGRWWGASGTSGAGDAGGQGGAGGAPVDADVFQLSVNVERIFGAHCAPCHAGRKGVVLGDFGDIYDSNELINRGLIVPLQPEASRLYLMVAEGQMPPALTDVDPETGVVKPGFLVDPTDPSKRITAVSTEDKAYLRAWIAAGAPPLFDELGRPRLSGAQLRAALLDDLATLPPAERRHYRYVSLYSDYARSSYSRVELNVVAAGVSQTLNRLSPSRPQIVPPSPVLGPDDQILGLRVDLRAYDLDPADWARLEAATELIDRQAFPCEVPFLGADQVLELASDDEHLRTDGTVESLYSNIVLRRFLERAGVLGPGQLVFEPAPSNGGAFEPLASEVTLPQLAGALGVDLARDVELGTAMRACGAASQVFFGARCVQRDPLPGQGVGFWWTMDVVNDSAQNPLLNPVGPGNKGLVPAAAGGDGFELSEGQALWSWPNASTGFAIFDDQLRLRTSSGSTSEAPTEYPEFRTVSARTCLGCHTTPLIPMIDEARPLLDSGALEPAEAEFVGRLFPPQSDIDAQIALDIIMHGEWARAACVKGCTYAGNTNIWWGGASPSVVTPDKAANYLYLDIPAFHELVESDPALPRSLFAPETIDQAVFVGAFPALRRAAIAAGGDEAALNFCVQPAGGD